MAKRFTDISKWRNEWFRTLPIKAKIAWIYLCDECDYAGIWKADYGLASFQLDFSLTNDFLVQWFGSKIYGFDSDNVLIVQFFEFQYGQSKDSWNAKVTARSRLESLGFKIENNKVLVPQTTHSPPTVGGQSPTILITGKGTVTGKVNNKRIENEKFLEAFALYPVRAKGSDAETRFREQIKTEQDFINLLQSIKHYCEHLAKPENSWRRPKQSFAAYLGTKASGFFWTDWIESDGGSSTLKSAKGMSDDEFFSSIRKQAGA